MINHVAKKFIDILEGSRKVFLEDRESDVDNRELFSKDYVYRKIKMIDEDALTDHIMLLSEHIKQLQTWKDILSSTSYGNHSKDLIDQLDDYDLKDLNEIIDNIRGGIDDRLDNFDIAVDRALKNKYSKKADPEKISQLVKLIKSVGESAFEIGIDLSHQTRDFRILSRLLLLSDSLEESELKKALENISERDFERIFVIFKEVRDVVR